MGRRIREGVKAVIGQVLEEEMTEHLGAGYEGSQSRRGEQNGYSTRDLIKPAGKMAQLWVPRDREGTFLTEVFARYKRMTGEVAVHLGLGPQSGPEQLGSSPARGARWTWPRWCYSGSRRTGCSGVTWTWPRSGPRKENPQKSQLDQEEVGVYVVGYAGGASFELDVGHGPSPPPVLEVDHLEEQVHLQGAALHLFLRAQAGKKMNASLPNP
jgi:hypothetical protein